MAVPLSVVTRTVEELKEPRTLLDHVDVDVEGREDRRELDSDDAAANDGEALRDFGHREDGVGVIDAGRAPRHERWLTGARPGRDHDDLRRDLARRDCIPFDRRHEESVSIHELRASSEPHAVDGAEQIRHARRARFDGVEHVG